MQQTGGARMRPRMATLGGGRVILRPRPTLISGCSTDASQTDWLIGEGHRFAEDPRKASSCVDRRERFGCRLAVLAWCRRLAYPTVELVGDHDWPAGDPHGDCRPCDRGRRCELWP